MQLVCIYKYGYSFLTLEKVYDVFPSTWNSFRSVCIINDIDRPSMYDRNFFISLGEYRRRRIDNILMSVY